MLALADEPRLLSSLPGRVRMHVPGWRPGARTVLEQRIRALPGVRTVQANELTHNVLIKFDPHTTPSARLLELVAGIEAHKLAPRHDSAIASRPHIITDEVGGRKRVRISVRGLDRDPDLARRIVEHLEERHGVTASASPLTGRVLIDFGHKIHELEEIVAEVEHLEIPDVPGEDRPRHPLDPNPLYQSLARVAGATFGLGFVVTRRILDAHGTPDTISRSARAAGLIGLVQGFPFIRNGLRNIFGRTAADLMLYVPVMATLAMSESVLGLTVTGIEAMRMLVEILARRSQFRRYEDHLGDTPSNIPGSMARVDSGHRPPRNGTIVEGNGVGFSRDGLPRPIQPGDPVTAGTKLMGGPFVIHLEGDASFVPTPRPEEARPRLYEKYVSAVGLGSLLFAGLNVALRRNFTGVLESLLLVNPRAAVIGNDLSNIGATSRVLRAGVTVIDSRDKRHIHKPDLILIDNPRIITNGLEISRVYTLTDIYDGTEVLDRASGVATASGGPWGSVLASLSTRTAENGVFENRAAYGHFDGRRWRLSQCIDPTGVPAAVRKLHPGEATLLVSEENGSVKRGRKVSEEWRDVGVIFLRPRLASGVETLVDRCARHGIRLGLLIATDRTAAEVLAARTRIPLVEGSSCVAIYDAQAKGDRVWYVSDHSRSAEAFANCDLAIAISTGRSGRFQARADLLSPDLGGLSAIVDASVRRETSVKGGIFTSLLGNVVGAIWGLRGGVRPEKASQPIYIAAIAASLFGAWCMRGGERHRSVMLELADPRPEKWGARSVDNVLTTLAATPHGLTSEQALARRPRHVNRPRVDELWKTLFDQFRSPLPGILAGAGGLALFLGAYLDFAVIAGTLAVNVAVGAWQERQAGRAAEAMQRIAAPAARLLRNGHTVMVGVDEVVTGDILVLAPGDRVSSDARLIMAHALEVDEASLTGESNPIPKAPNAHVQASRVVLEGSDIVSGHGRAVVFAVGRNTRLGATAAALAFDETQQTPLGQRLGRLLRQVLPLATVGGAVVLGAGILRRQPLLPQLAIGASIALAAVPEGLPLLAGMGQVAVSKRLAKRNALVRRLSAVEALGRVDVACSDKTGTMTLGKLRVALVADLINEAEFDGKLADGLSQVLCTAAWASPHPEAADAGAHPTDVSVIQAAERAGLRSEIRYKRERSAPFDPARSFHAATVRDRLRLKGAPEVVGRLCTQIRIEGADRPMDEAMRKKVLARADALAQRGLRVLMVAEGSGELEPDRPAELVALGFIGIRDPLRENAAEAIDNCHQAGIRVIMLTGDHPSTARAIARDAGLPIGDGNLLTGAEIENLSDEELDERLENVTVIARATPLDKLRIIEGLKRRGHVVAMTGDGVNDAPALRLADVGVAMGQTGTEVARQAADLILGDDDFSTLVAALIEGRSFWRNMRRSLGLLLGGNLGELGLVCGASLLGFPAPLTTRQILAVNLITDALPAMSVVLQKPEHRHLADLKREGVNAVDVSLRTDAMRRSVATMVPAFFNYFLTMRSGNILQARTVAFGSIVVTQLAQTLDAGWARGTFTHPVMKAIGASSALLVSFMVSPPLQGVFGLAMPGGGWMMTGVAGVAAVMISRSLAALGFTATAAAQRALPLRPTLRALPSPT